jgi:hypothetical protein
MDNGMTPLARGLGNLPGATIEISTWRLDVAVQRGAVTPSPAG